MKNKILVLVLVTGVVLLSGCISGSKRDFVIGSVEIQYNKSNLETTGYIDIVNTGDVPLHNCNPAILYRDNSRSGVDKEHPENYVYVKETQRIYVVDHNMRNFKEFSGVCVQCYGPDYSPEKFWGDKPGGEDFLTKTKKTPISIVE